MKTQLLKRTAWFLAAVFCLTQVAPAGFSAPNLNDLPTGTGLSATVNLDAEVKKPKPQPEPVPIVKTVPDSINFLSEGFSSPLSRDEKKPMPPRVVPIAVQAIVDALQKQLGGGFNVTVGSVKCAPNTKCVSGGYVITVTDAKMYKMTPTSGLKSMSFNVDANGVIDTAINMLTKTTSFEARYYSAKGDILVDGKLLYEAARHILANRMKEAEDKGIHLFMPHPVETYLLGRMTTFTNVQPQSDGSIKFQDGDRAYRVTRKGVLEKELTPQERAIAAVKAALANSMGLTDKQLDALIESIKWDGKGVIVTFKAGNMGESRQIDVLGGGKLPTTAYFKLDKNQALLSAEFTWGTRSGNYKITTASVNYIDGKISEVHWSRESGFFCAPKTVCPMYSQPPMGELLYRDVYTYGEGEVRISRGPVVGKIGSLWQPTQLIVLVFMEDGQYHINAVQDYDAAGKVIATSRFDYLTERVHIMCLKGAVCPPVSPKVHLYQIYRTDTAGHMLSVITINGDKALITLADGQAKEVPLASFDTLLAQARKFEIANPVQAYINALKEQLGDGFSVAAELQKDGTYLVKVGRLSSCPEGAYCMMVAPAPGTFSSMEFSVSANGAVKSDSVKATFVGMDNVDGTLLYAALSQFKQQYTRPIVSPVRPVITNKPEKLPEEKISVEVIKDVYVKIDPALLLMAKVTVTGIGSIPVPKTIHFTMPEDAAYICYYDADGNVKVEATYSINGSKA